MALLVEGGLILAAWGVGEMLDTPAFGLVELSVSAVVVGVLGCIPMLLGLGWVDRSMWPPLVRFRRTIDQDVSPIFASCTVGDVVLISALAGIGEEAMFRGVMQMALADAVGVGGAVAITAVVFGAAHFITTTYAVYATLIGVYLGLLLVVFENLLVPILAHAVYDFLALVYLVFLRPPAAPIAFPEQPPAE